MHACLSQWPLERPRNWLADVHRPIQETRAREIQQSIVRGAPLGSEGWKTSIAGRLGLTLRQRGRQCKQPEKSPRRLPSGKQSALTFVGVPDIQPSA